MGSAMVVTLTLLPMIAGHSGVEVAQNGHARLLAGLADQTDL